MKIELFPLEKVCIDGKEIFLNASQKTVEETIGKSTVVGNRHYYFESELAVDYNDDGLVEFIEFLGGSDSLLKPIIYGVSAFDAPANELTELLAEKNQGKIDDSEDGYSYAFMEISVGIYRELIPADIEEMIEEMREDGIPIENNEDLERDKMKANHWQTIGMGVENYYS